MKAAKADGAGDPQRSREFRAAFSDLRASVCCFLHDELGALVKRAAILGDRKLARRSMQKLRAETALELGQSFAHDQIRQLHAAGGLADRTALRDGHEDATDSSFSIVLFSRKLGQAVAACQGQFSWAIIPAQGGTTCFVF
jgi:hypothetical protein